MKWQGNVIFKGTFEPTDFTNTQEAQDIMEEIVKWAKAHGVSERGVKAEMAATGGWDSRGYSVMIMDAIVDSSEFDEDQFLTIAGRPAYLGTGSVLREVTMEEFKPKSIIDIISEALNLLTHDEQEQLLDKTLREILGRTRGDTFGKSTIFVLSNTRKVSCPCCSTVGTINVIDGELKCRACGHSWGDIDNLPDTI